MIACATAGAILGDNIGFAIGRRGGRGLAERHGGKIGLTPARLRQFDRFFDKYGAPTVFIARFVTGLRVFCAVLAGGSGLALAHVPVLQRRRSDCLVDGDRGARLQPRL